MYKFGFVLLIVISLVGCDLFDGDSSRKLGSENWILTSYHHGDLEIFNVIPGTSYKLNFNEVENTVSGTIDCNSYNSIYSTANNVPTKGADLIIEHIAPTEILCPYATNASDIELEQYHDQNSIVLLALSTIDYYSIGATKLRIQSVGGQALYFEPSNGD
jgi:heat shock protein HslJ